MLRCNVACPFHKHHRRRLVATEIVPPDTALAECRPGSLLEPNMVDGALNLGELIPLCLVLLECPRCCSFML